MDWDGVARELGPRLHRYFRGASFADEQAADLAQETLIRLVRKHADGAYDPARGSLAMYAFGLARHVRLEAWKAAPREDAAGAGASWAPEAGGGPSALEDLEAEETRRRLRGAIAELSEVQREITLLLLDEERTLPEVAAHLNLPLNTIKSHVHRAKALLRARLTPPAVGGDLSHA